MKTTNTARRPDLTLEDKSKKIICIVDMGCPYESNIREKGSKNWENTSNWRCAKDMNNTGSWLYL